jgi:hypothetical protein
MASGHVNRTYRPNTWLHRPMLQNVKKALANSEPSTHGTFETCRPALTMSGPSYVSGELAEWLDEQRMAHVRGAPNHPQTQGKIERWHQTLKNRILLENYYLPGDLEACIGRFVEYYNHQRYHESLKNFTPADVYFGRGQTILLKRKRIKRDTIKNRRLQHQKKAA